MDSLIVDEASSASERDTPTPTRCAHPRSRSATMIPYVPSAKANNAADLQILSPVPRPFSPFPDFSSEEAASLESENEKVELAAPPPPVRTVSPFPNHPYVTDARSLQLAVSQDPDHIFEAIKNLIKERDNIRHDLIRASAELQSVTEDLIHTRLDYKVSRHRYEELFRVASAKQVILWKYIESLHSQLAVLKDEPDPNVGAGHGMSLHMGVRGGAGMGIAMEKWISEGLDSDWASRNGEEGSEKSTEHSFWSADGSFGTKSLDPHAHIFVPQIGSPQKLRQRSPERVPKYQSPSEGCYVHVPSTPSTSYSVQDPFKNQQQPHYSPQPMMFPAIAQQPLPPPNILMAHLPLRWYGICPHSLATASPCPLGLKCQFTPLCYHYNSPGGEGCASFKNGGPAACKFVHEYRFCEEVNENKKGGCVWERNTAEEAASLSPGKKSGGLHVRLRVHKSQIDEAEWDARIILLSMREAHARGIFNGQQMTGRGRSMF